MVSREEFLEVYQRLKQELLEDNDAFTYTEDSRNRVEEMLDYNVPKGKLARGLTVVETLKHLKNGLDLHEDEKFMACVLGWCVEWLEAFLIIMDDIMDSALMRRAQPCWHRVPKVGLIAINDGIMLRNHVFRLLRSHFKNKSYYIELNDLFNEIEFQTCAGELLDLITTPLGDYEMDISKLYLPPRQLKIVQYKAAYYSFYLPVACALLMSGESLEKHEATKDILVQMGTYFQITDDYLDCYGDPMVFGKVPTDIKDNKCSWLIVQALKIANEDQKRTLLENYGKSNPACVATVEKVYEELDLQHLFLEYEKETYAQLIAKIEAHENEALQVALKSFFAKIYKRRK